MASAAGVTRCPTVLVVRTMAVVRVAGVTALGPVADALIALVLVLVTVAVIIIAVTVVIAGAARAADHRSAGNRHVSDSHASGVSLGSRPRVPVQAATGHGDRRAGQDVALENRTRNGRCGDCCGLGDPPRHIASLRTASQEYRKVGSRKSAGARGA